MCHKCVEHKGGIEPTTLSLSLPYEVLLCSIEICSSSGRREGGRER